MTGLRSGTNATDLIKAISPREVTPLDIAERAGCTVMSVMTEALTGNVTSVSRIANLANPDAPFEQGTAANQASMVDSATFGRKTLEFDTARDRYYTLGTTVDYASAFSLLAVFRSGVVDTLMNVLGDEDTVTATRAGLHMQTNGKLRARIGSSVVGSETLTADTWYAAIMSFNGSESMTIEVLGQSAITGAVSGSVTGTALRISDNTGAFGLDGQVDMAAMFNVELNATAQADLLADVKLMLAQTYDTTVTGLV